MQINTTEVRCGKYIGKEVWICHYNRPDMNKKPLRNLQPTKVLIRPISELPKNKIVSYSEVFFSTLNKKGDPTAKIISPVDNTGNRNNFGNEIYIFNNEKECKESWNKQLRGYLNAVDNLIHNAANYWVNEKYILVNLMSKTTGI